MTRILILLILFIPKAFSDHYAEFIYDDCKITIYKANKDLEDSYEIVKSSLINEQVLRHVNINNSQLMHSKQPFMHLSMHDYQTKTRIDLCNLKQLLPNPEYASVMSRDETVYYGHIQSDMGSVSNQTVWYLFNPRSTPILKLLYSIKTLTSLMKISYLNLDQNNKNRVKNLANYISMLKEDDIVEIFSSHTEASGPEIDIPSYNPAGVNCYWQLDRHTKMILKPYQLSIVREEGLSKQTITLTDDSGMSKITFESYLDGSSWHKQKLNINLNELKIGQALFYSSHVYSTSNIKVYIDRSKVKKAVELLGKVFSNPEEAELYFNALNALSFESVQHYILAHKN